MCALILEICTHDRKNNTAKLKIILWTILTWALLSYKSISLSQQGEVVVEGNGDILFNRILDDENNFISIKLDYF